MFFCFWRDDDYRKQQMYWFTKPTMRTGLRAFT